MIKGLKKLLWISFSFFVLIIVVISSINNKAAEKEEVKIKSDAVKEIDYIIKAKIANNLYIKDRNPEAKISLLFADQQGKLLTFDFVKDIFENANENYEYVYLTGGNFILGSDRYRYESIIGIERGNKNATYGISGIEIIYFHILE